MKKNHLIYFSLIILISFAIVISCGKKSKTTTPFEPPKESPPTKDNLGTVEGHIQSLIRANISSTGQLTTARQLSNTSSYSGLSVSITGTSTIVKTKSDDGYYIFTSVPEGKNRIVTVSSPLENLVGKVILDVKNGVVNTAPPITEHTTLIAFYVEEILEKLKSFPNFYNKTESELLDKAINIDEIVSTMDSFDFNRNGIFEISDFDIDSDGIIEKNVFSELTNKSSIEYESVKIALTSLIQQWETCFEKEDISICDSLMSDNYLFTQQETGGISMNKQSRKTYILGLFNEYDSLTFTKQNPQISYIPGSSIATLSARTVLSAYNNVVIKSSLSKFNFTYSSSSGWKITEEIESSTPSNNPPQIKQVYFLENVYPLQNVKFTALIFEPDSDDFITTWTSTHGTFEKKEKDFSIWKAPLNPGTSTIVLSVKDFGVPNLSSSKTFHINVTSSYFKCETRPSYCIEVYDPVCGFDGKDYISGCEACKNNVASYRKGTCSIDAVPVASAGKDKTGIASTTLTFDASSSYDDKGIISYMWDFDASNGITEDAKGIITTHTYTTPGTYSVMLTIYDEIGHIATDTITVTITYGNPIAIKITPPVLTTKAGKKEPLIAKGVDSASNEFDISPRWSFAPQNSKVSISTYGIFYSEATGTFNVKAELDINNKTLSAESLITVLPGDLKTFWVDPMTVAIGATSTFNIIAKDAFGNNITDPIKWTLNGNIGTISENGIFSATREGFGYAIAELEGKQAVSCIAVTSIVFQ